ncbi:MAG: hypothetical protein RIQ81_1622 [Pseudomonadota bacterium]|jgi:inosine/guanosine/xanthosine phosphorylase family protein
MPGLIDQARDFLRQRANAKPAVFMVAGSGFRDALPALTDEIRIPMQEVPGLPAPAVAGHGADLIFGNFAAGARKIPVMIATGRVHIYEGRSAGDVVFATRLAHALGCSHVVLTNAAGSVNPELRPGTLMALADQINMTGHNCESGPKPAGQAVQFTDMTEAYDPDWRSRVLAKAGLLEGVYAGLTGPSYETSAETRMMRLLGADVVGMSTVQECIAARTLGMKVFGLSLVTNMAGGLGKGKLDHHDVLALGRDKQPEMRGALTKILAEIKSSVR